MNPILSKCLAIIVVSLIAATTHSMIEPVRLPQRGREAAPAAPATPEAMGVPTERTVAPMAAAPGPSGAQASAANVNPADAAAPASGALGLEIRLEQAFALFSEGKPFFDARHQPEYAAGHVQDAVLTPTDEFNAKLGELMAYRDETVVIYCGGGQCDASHNLAILLENAGFKKLHIMVDGFPAWEKAGYPVGRGDASGKGG